MAHSRLHLKLSVYIFTCVLFANFKWLKGQNGLYIEVTPLWSVTNQTDSFMFGTLFIERDQVPLYGGRFGLGYQWKSLFSAGLSGEAVFEDKRLRLELLRGEARFFPFRLKKLDPYILLGYAKSLSQHTTVTFSGPYLGWGLSVALTPDFSLIGSAQYRFDFLKSNIVNRRITYDYLIGLKYQFGKKISNKTYNNHNNFPHDIAVIGREIPAALQINQPAYFAITLLPADSAARIKWHFSDGQKAEGEEVHLVFSEKGTLRGTLEVVLGRRKTIENFTVEIIEPIDACVQPIISEIQVPGRFMEGETTRIIPHANGSYPLRYAWRFPLSLQTGRPEPEVRLPAGFQEIELFVQNECGEALRTTRVFVMQNPACKVIRPIPPVRFSPGNIELDTNAQLALEQSLDQLSACPSVCLSVQAFGDGTEPTALRAKQRANHTVGFLVARGIPATRIQEITSSAQPEASCKAISAPNCRRAEIRVVPCE